MSVENFMEVYLIVMEKKNTFSHFIIQLLKKNIKLNLSLLYAAFYTSLSAMKNIRKCQEEHKNSLKHS